jgi:hypothetical protein
MILATVSEVNRSVCIRPLDNAVIRPHSYCTPTATRKGPIYQFSDGIFYRCDHAPDGQLVATKATAQELNQLITAAEASLPPEAPVNRRFEKKDNTWNLQFDQESGALQNAKGLKYIAILLKAPNKVIPAVRLIQMTKGVRNTGTSIISPDEDDGATYRPNEALPYEVFDAEAEEAYYLRMNELKEEIHELRRNNDFARVEKLQKQLDCIAKYVKEGRIRNGRRVIVDGDQNQKARISICKALTRTYESMKTNDPALPNLAGYLRKHIKTRGTSYSYRPEANAPKWQC